MKKYKLTILRSLAVALIAVCASVGAVRAASYFYFDSYNNQLVFGGSLEFKSNIPLSLSMKSLQSSVNNDLTVKAPQDIQLRFNSDCNTSGCYGDLRSDLADIAVNQANCEAAGFVWDITGTLPKCVISAADSTEITVPQQLACLTAKLTWVPSVPATTPATGQCYQPNILNINNGANKKVFVIDENANLKLGSDVDDHARVDRGDRPVDPFPDLQVEFLTS